VWGRGVGGHVTSSATATAGNIMFGTPVAGSITCNTRTAEDFTGVQIGTDVAKLNVNGWNLHAGSTIGYLGSKTQDTTPPARIGYAYWDHVLVYVKGGAAVAQDQANFACSTGSQPTIVPLAGCPAQSDSKTKTGWTVGWGSEFGLTPNVSVKSETMYFDLGSDRYNIAGILANIQRSAFISTVGLHLRIN
jgi:opacity protein-like surface antigen